MTSFNHSRAARLCSAHPRDIGVPLTLHNRAPAEADAQRSSCAGL
jgi:hypothetical protein